MFETYGCKKYMFETTIIYVQITKSNYKYNLDRSETCL